MGIYNSLTGLLEVEVTSADPEKTLDNFRLANIDVSKVVKYNELAFSVVVSRKQYDKIRVQCQNQGSSCEIRNRIGIYWKLRAFGSRPVLLFTCIVLFFLMAWLPSRVLFVRVEGNRHIPSNKIIETAEKCGVSFGKSRRRIRSESVKNGLLQEIPQLQWAGVNTAGTVAVISVREKEVLPEQNDITEPSNLYAAIDAHVLSCTATSGTLMVKPGDSVRKGQVLISGYTDCGICIRAERASGEITGQTTRHLDVKMPATVLVKDAIHDVKRKYSLLLRKKRIFLWKDSGIWDGSCGRMYEEYYITLPRGFRLPIALCIETYSVGERFPEEISQESASAVMQSFADRYLHQQMVAGKIRNRIHAVTTCDGYYRLNSRYSCEEMIGTTRQMQIGDRNGQDN